jgi:sialic acid synthase SpsE
MRAIAEMGSCHMGKFHYAKEAIDRLSDMNVWAIKFQLFPNEKKYLESGNIWLDPNLYLKIAEYAEKKNLHCSASVFDEWSFRFLSATRPTFIKFSYSKKDEVTWIQETLENNIEAIVSCDVMSDQYVPEGATKLFCIPHYPVYHQISFDEIFPRFHGFSDHTLGIKQSIKAAAEGATTIEKHFKLEYPDITCPDSFFAITPEEFSQMCEDTYCDEISRGPLWF